MTYEQKKDPPPWERWAFLGFTCEVLPIGQNRRGKRMRGRSVPFDASLTSVSLHVGRVQATNLPLSISLPILEDETQLAANGASLLVSDLDDLLVGGPWHQYALPPVSIDYTFSHSYARLYDFLRHFQGQRRGGHPSR